MQHYQSSAVGDTSDLLHDISIASPSVLGAQNVNASQTQADDIFKKAKLRLETVCLLLAENGAK